MWPRITIMKQKFTTLEYSPRYSRLKGELTSYRPLLDRRIADANAASASWAVQALKLLDITEDYLRHNKIDEAWKSLHTARRLEIHSYTDAERLATAKIVYHEAEKLNEWRKESIINMLGTKKEGVTQAPDIATLIKAVEVKDEDYDNQYYRNRLARNMFWLLSSILFIVISSIVLYIALVIQNLGSDYGNKLSLTGYIIGVVLFGLLGALTSAILFTRNTSQSSRITELGSSDVITLSKLFIGAGFSIFIYLLLRSSASDSIKLFNFTVSTPYDYFAIAFVSGFSEILARKAINLLLGKETENSKKKPSGNAV